MKPRIIIGVFAGIIGLALNSCVATIGGTMGSLVVFALTGCIAGFLTTRKEGTPNSQEGLRAGLVAGSIAGILVMFGQFVAMVLLMLFLPASVSEIPSSDASFQLGYEVGKLTLRSICIGFPLSVAMGAGMGYIGTPKHPKSPSESPFHDPSSQ